MSLTGIIFRKTYTKCKPYKKNLRNTTYNTNTIQVAKQNKSCDMCNVGCFEKILITSLRQKLWITWNAITGYNFFNWSPFDIFKTSFYPWSINASYKFVSECRFNPISKHPFMARQSWWQALSTGRVSVLTTWHHTLPMPGIVVRMMRILGFNHGVSRKHDRRSVTRGGRVITITWHYMTTAAANTTRNSRRTDMPCLASRMILSFLLTTDRTYVKLS